MSATIAGKKRVVCWGIPKTDLHSHRHIWRGFHDAARKMGIPAVMLHDTPEDAQSITSDDLVFVIDIWMHHLPVVPGARYVFHNVPGDDPVFEMPEHQWIRLQVYSNNATGERFGPCRYWLAENRTLSQPWGTDLFAEEFYEPVFNPANREAVFVGAIWDSGGLGNDTMIADLKQTLHAAGLRFEHRTQIPDEEMIALTRNARLAPAFAGAWQVEHDYLPCRVFKNVSYGQLAITNVPRFYDLFADCSLQGETIPELIDEALRLKRDEWLNMVVEQQRVVRRFTYRESLEAIERAFAA